MSPGRLPHGGISRRFCRYISQDVCPWSITFAKELAEDSPFATREAIVGRDARHLAREVLSMSQAEFSVAFKDSPMKRAKLRGLKRNAAVVLGNLRTASHSEKTAAAEALRRALDDSEPLVREHAAWALGRIEVRR